MTATMTLKISSHLHSARSQWATLQMTLAAHCATGRAGRVLLHLLCACGDHQIRWHMQGIAREFAGQVLMG